MGFYLLWQNERYGSIFGDSNRLKLDLCQHCLKDVLGQWITVCDQ